MRCAVFLVALIGCGTSRPQVARDAALDAYVDPCDVCTADQLCVQRFDGVCDPAPTVCVPRAATCLHPVVNNQPCSQQCQDAYCPQPYQCTTRFGCPATVPTSPTAFTCYGP